VAAKKHVQILNHEQVTNKERYTVEQVANALERSYGVYSGAAKQLGCSPNTIRNYVDRYPALREICNEALERMLDYSELQLFRKIREGSLPAITFFLRNKGRSRGYCEKHEIGGNVNVDATLNGGLAGLYAELERRQRMGEESE